MGKGGSQVSEFAQSPQPEDGSSVKPEAGRAADEPEAVEEDLPDEPSSHWQMVQDEGSQYCYYWNTRTNEVTWEIPSEYTQFLLLHKEYTERVARYTPDQLVRMRERKAGKINGSSSAKS